jgi:hypothetical protein
MMQDMSWTAVRMLFQSTLETLGFGTVCVSVVVLMEDSAILTVTQVAFKHSNYLCLVANFTQYRNKLSSKPGLVDHILQMHNIIVL